MKLLNKSLFMHLTLLLAVTSGCSGTDQRHCVFSCYFRNVAVLINFVILLCALTVILRKNYNLEREKNLLLPKFIYHVNLCVCIDCKSLHAKYVDNINVSIIYMSNLNFSNVMITILRHILSIVSSFLNYFKRFNIVSSRSVTLSVLMSNIISFEVRQRDIFDIEEIRCRCNQGR